MIFFCGKEGFYRQIKSVETVVFMLGCCLGSTLNVISYRSVRNEDYLLGRSRCPHCGHVLSFTDMVPLVSFILLNGRCRHCHQRISWRYPLAELWMGAVTASLFRYHHDEFILYELFVSVLFLIALTDMETMEIPDGLLMALAVTSLWHAGGSCMDALLSGAVIAVPMLILMKLTSGFGFGDVIIVMAAGIFLGDWHTAVSGFVCSLLVASIQGIVLLVKGKKTMSEPMPFAPALCAGYTLIMIICD